METRSKKFAVLTPKTEIPFDWNCFANMEELKEVFPNGAKLVRLSIFERMINDPDRIIQADYHVKFISVRMTNEEYYNFEDIV